MGLFEALFGKKKLTLEGADKKNDDFIAKNPLPQNNENEMMRNAAKLMSSKNFTESIILYEKLAEEYPKNKGLYESQIGAAYYFLGDYTKAVEYYISALNNGGNKSMMDDNIWEAAEAASKLDVLIEDGSINSPNYLIKKYVELFPDGEYIKKAKSILDKMESSQ